MRSSIVFQPIVRRLCGAWIARAEYELVGLRLLEKLLHCFKTLLAISVCKWLGEGIRRLTSPDEAPVATTVLATVVAIVPSLQIL